MNCTAKYFLAANSAEGFFSEFPTCYDPYDGWRAYIIKGGPGTGKSSFMRQLLEKAEEKQIAAEVVFCTGDPDSLDAVILPTLKTVVMDGTAPHVVDPALPGVSDKILNFGEFWDDNKFNHPKDLMHVFKQNKVFHKEAAKYICAAGKVMEAALSRMDCVQTKDTRAYGKMIADKFLPKLEQEGSFSTRYLGGVTPKGVKYFTESAMNRAKNTVVISDACGKAANEILEVLKLAALKRGYDTVVYKNPILPLQLLDAVFVPLVSLFVVREYALNRCFDVSDKVFADRFYLHCDLNQPRDEELINNLIQNAVDRLSYAKSVHDEMEKHYIAAMNFEQLKKYCDLISKEIFGE